MDKVVGRLTVFFEQPFWVGVFECISEGNLSVCKVTFCAEPKDYEVYDFVLKNYYEHDAPQSIPGYRNHTRTPSLWQPAGVSFPCL